SRSARPAVRRRWASTPGRRSGSTSATLSSRASKTGETPWWPRVPPTSSSPDGWWFIAVRWPRANRTGVCPAAAPTYVSNMVTAAARPHVFWVGDDPATQELVRGWPVGRALLETLSDANSDVREALTAERARLSYH